MNRIKSFLFTILAISCFLTLTANAQRGHVRLSAASTGHRGVHPDGEPALSGFEVYMMAIGTTANGAPTSMISCDNYGVLSNVGSDDGGVTCYAIADGSGDFDLTGLYYGYYSTDGTGCETGAAQTVYLEIRQGDVGGTSNPTLGFMGVPYSAWNCDYIYNNAGSVFFDVSDFTNVMAAFGLAPFANWNNPTSPNTVDGISAAGTAGKADLLLAFDAINAIIPINTGAYGGSGTSTTAKQLNTIADAISVCVEGTSSSPGCSALLGYADDSNLGFTGTHAPVNT